MRQIVVLLATGFVMSGCARQETSPTSMPKPSARVHPPATNQAAKITKQTSRRFTDFSPNGKFFVVGLWHSEYKVINTQKISGSLEIWDVGKGKKIATSQFSDPIAEVAFLPKKNLLLVNSDTLQLCDLKSGRVVKRLANRFFTRKFAVSFDEKFIAFPIEDRIEVRNADDWKLYRKIKIKSPKASFIRAMDYSPNGSRLASGAWDVSDGVEVYDVKSARKVWTVEGDQQGDIVWSPDGRHIAASVTTGVLLLRARDGYLIKKFPSDYGSLIRFSPNGRRLIFTNNNLLVTYDVRSQKVIGQTRIKNLSSFVLSPDARVLAMVSKDGSQVTFQRVATAGTP